MFERFTHRARQVVVLAQEEARALNHGYIGTEHLLLGLIHEGNGVAAQALESLDISLDAVRRDVLELVGRGQGSPAERIPFTPRAKKSLELALREALALDHNYIGTEHLLLGLLREGDGVAAQVLVQEGGGLDAVRAAVVGLLGQSGRAEEQRPTAFLSRLLRRRSAVPASPPTTTPAAERGLAEAHRLAGDGAIGSQHLLLASISDPASVAARSLTAAGVDLEVLREQLRRVEVAGTADDLPEQAGRRGMTLRMTGDALVVEVTDPVALDAARRAVGDGGELPGTEPSAAPLAEVWQSLLAALREVADSKPPA